MGPLPIIHRGKRQSNRGATLIELLAAVVVMGILTALLMPAFARVRGAGESAKCVSNLKQIGAGMAEYVADHDGYLPGPLSGGAHAFYGAEDSVNPVSGGRLASFLQAYIAKPVATGGGTFKSEVFVCPSFARQIKVGSTDQGQTPYRIRKTQLSNTGTGEDNPALYVFGSQASGGSDPTPPQRLARLSGSLSTPLSQTPAIQDYDGDMSENAFGKDSHNPKWFPDHPVHAVYKKADHGNTIPAVKEAHPGAYRNALFLDFHVERLNMEGK